MITYDILQFLWTLCIQNSFSLRASFFNCINVFLFLQTHAYCEEPDVVLCGNKCDLEDRREISEQKVREIAEKYG